MNEISKTQLDLEKLEISLWQAPSPSPDSETLSALSLFDAGDNSLGVGNKSVEDDSPLPDLGPLAKFRTWESVGSTIVHKAVTTSNFNPGSEKFDPVAWENFLRKFSTIPFFLTYTSDYREAAISKTSLEQAVNAVSDLIENIVTKVNFEGIVKSIKKVGELAVENKGEKQSNSNQQIGVLSRHDRHLYLGTVRTSVAMEYKSGKGYEQLNQQLNVYRGYGVLDFDKCKRNAETLLKWDTQDVEEWEQDTASYPVPPNESPAWNN
ncbi:hypothetical protein SAMN05216553_104421 [Lentzea fradiae]|uniref:Virulence factor Evf domain-containing protein n=1 Tax=Lentzea fradiae TaxID=200378 RepID=A0A1G7QI68_9PSEU|nr:hypothetical protein [Lentzea fradiae]SDF97320.1 hypothetical protein SAMN05216553_104421 [Lentzea fradiae]